MQNLRPSRSPFALRLIRFTLAFGLLAVTLAILPPTTVAQTNRDIVCRNKLAIAVRKYGTYLTVRTHNCHQQRIRGRLPAAIECNDPDTWEAHGYDRGVRAVALDRKRLRDQINGCRADAPDPPGLGYVTCPSPCEAVSTATFTGLSDCLQCVVDDVVLPVQQALIGTPPLPLSRAAKSCQKLVGRNLTAFLNKRIKLHHDCQFLQDFTDDAPFQNIDCEDLEQPIHPYYGRMLNTRGSIDRLTRRRCANFDIPGELDTCGADVEGLLECLYEHGDEISATIYFASFPPFPTP